MITKNVIIISSTFCFCSICPFRNNLATWLLKLDLIILPKLRWNPIRTRTRGWINGNLTFNSPGKIINKTVSPPHQESSFSRWFIVREDIVSISWEIIFRTIVAGTWSISGGFCKSSWTWRIPCLYHRAFMIAKVVLTRGMNNLFGFMGSRPWNISLGCLVLRENYLSKEIHSE